MLNIVIPMAGKSIFFESSEYIYPKPLIEVNGKTMIELVINNLNELTVDKNFIFILKNDNCAKYHIDNTIKLLTDDKATIMYVDGDTRGAVCTALLSIEYINNDDSLIIANSDQIIEKCLMSAYNDFTHKNYDAAVITFESVHPKWSYVKLGDMNEVIETAEKKPISKNAIAGLYYFNKGKYFVEAAFHSIEKDVNLNGLYFIAPVLNEMILKNYHLGTYAINSSQYHSFYSPQKIQEYEKLVRQ
mgnify:CR=1 FL=1